MAKEFTLAVAGDSINRMRLSLCKDEGFLSLVDVIRGADASFTQLEVLVHDYEGPELYPAAEGGHNWSRAPHYVVEELKWAGFDILSTASNHSLDYSYGGMFSTWNALRKAEMPFAGTGMNLAEARQAAYLETEKARVGLVSMCSSFVKWGRAGDARPDMQGRPGVNPLRFNHLIDRATADEVQHLARKLGYQIHAYDNEILITTYGVANSFTRFLVRDEPGVTTVADEDDATGNLRSIAMAKQRSDFVIAHIHSHEQHPERGKWVAPEFIPPFARECIDAGADVFVAQGSHAPLRGIEIYNGKPIFYEPGDFIASNATRNDRMPAELYQRPGFSDEIRSGLATPAEAWAAMGDFDRETVIYPKKEHLAFGKACILPVCTFGEDGLLSELKVYPVSPLEGSVAQYGIPSLAGDDIGRKIIDHVAALSAEYGTSIDYSNGVGRVKV